MKTLLVCHENADLTRIGPARWLASFSQLKGMIVLRGSKKRTWRRIRREIKRVGIPRFVDVLAIRVYYKLFLARRDRAWEREAVDQLCRPYPPVRDGLPILVMNSPNNVEAEQFIRWAALTS